MALSVGLAKKAVRKDRKPGNAGPEGVRSVRAVAPQLERSADLGTPIEVLQWDSLFTHAQLLGFLINLPFRQQ